MTNFFEGLKGILPMIALALPTAGAAFLAVPAGAQTFPERPIELVCTTRPGSGAAAWCEMLAQELSKPDYLGVTVNVTYKSGGSNHEPVVYVGEKPTDGYTIMHMSASFHTYFLMPHFTKTFDDFDLLARFEKTVYGVAVLCNDPDLKSWDDLVAYNKANPGSLAMGSNKIGSTHHLHHVRIGLDPAGADLRFVPYEGTGDVVKDVLGGHLRVGFAQPGLWNPHIEAGTVCPLLILNEDRLDHPLWENVPSVPDVGMTYDIPHQWQGFMVKDGTPEEVKTTLREAMRKVTESDVYNNTYMVQNPHVMPDYRDDEAAIADLFKIDTETTREFLLEVGMLE